MRKKRNIFSLVITFLLIICNLTGCGNAGEQNPASDSLDNSGNNRENVTTSSSSIRQNVEYEDIWVVNQTEYLCNHFNPMFDEMFPEYEIVYDSESGNISKLYVERGAKDQENKPNILGTYSMGYDEFGYPYTVEYNDESNKHKYFIEYTPEGMRSRTWKEIEGKEGIDFGDRYYDEKGRLIEEHFYHMNANAESCELWKVECEYGDDGELFQENIYDEIMGRREIYRYENGERLAYCIAYDLETGEVIERRDYSYTEDGKEESVLELNTLQDYFYNRETKYLSDGRTDKRETYDDEGKIVLEEQYFYDDEGRLVLEDGYIDPGSLFVFSRKEYLYSDEGWMSEIKYYGENGEIVYSVSFDGRGDIIRVEYYNQENIAVLKYDFAYEYDKMDRLTYVESTETFFNDITQKEVTKHALARYEYTQMHVKKNACERIADTNDYRVANDFGMWTVGLVVYGTDYYLPFHEPVENMTDYFVEAWLRGVVNEEL